jgi:hypothetical protein
MIKTNQILYLVEKDELYNILYKKEDIALIRYNLAESRFENDSVDAVSLLLN